MSNTYINFCFIYPILKGQNYKMLQKKKKKRNGLDTEYFNNINIGKIKR